MLLRTLYSFSIMYLFLFNSELFKSQIRVFALGVSYFFAKLMLALIALLPSDALLSDTHSIAVSIPFSLMAFVASFFLLPRRKRKIKN